MTDALVAGERSQSPVFDYETKTWGGHAVGVSPRYLGALRLRYCLDDVADIRGSVLEVGCGAGAMAKALKQFRPDLEVVGCDISEKAIAQARQDPQGVSFEVGDAYGLPYGDGNFEGVVMFDVLEHLDDPGRLVREVVRLLSPGGLFHLFVPCEGELHTIHGILARLGWRAKEKYGGHIQRLTGPDVLAEFRAAQLDVIRTRWSGHLVNQLVDAAYFTALEVRGRNVATSIEGYLASAQRSARSLAVDLAKSAVAIASFYESVFVPWLPGSGIHVTGKKPGNL
jgi:SAM-dependent methyltransferase